MWIYVDFQQQKLSKRRFSEKHDDTAGNQTLKMASKVSSLTAGLSANPNLVCKIGLYNFVFESSLNCSIMFLFCCVFTVVLFSFYFLFFHFFIWKEGKGGNFVYLFVCFFLYYLKARLFSYV